MSWGSIKLIEELWGAWHRRDMEALFELYAEDIEYDVTAFTVEGETLYGHDGVRTWFRGLLESFDDYEAKAQEIVAANDRVLVKSQHTGIGKQSGAETKTMLWQIYETKGDKITRVRTFAEEAAAVRELGSGT